MKFAEIEKDSIIYDEQQKQRDEQERAINNSDALLEIRNLQWLASAGYLEGGDPRYQQIQTTLKEIQALEILHAINNDIWGGNGQIDESLYTNTHLFYRFKGFEIKRRGTYNDSLDIVEQKLSLRIGVNLNNPHLIFVECIYFPFNPWHDLYLPQGSYDNSTDYNVARTVRNLGLIAGLEKFSPRGKQRELTPDEINLEKDRDPIKHLHSTIYHVIQTLKQARSLPNDLNQRFQLVFEQLPPSLYQTGYVGSKELRAWAHHARRSNLLEIFIDRFVVPIAL